MHRFSLLLFFLLLCSLGNAYAQQSGEQKAKVTGRIVAAGGADFFTILLKDSVYGTTTDKDGNFELSVPQGNYVLLVCSLVAELYEQPITLKSGKLLNLGNIMVEDRAGELDQIVVTGQFTPQSMRNSLYKVRTVSNQIITKKAAAEVTQLLNTEIGIRLSNDMALGESSFELMGMSGTNVKILLNGMPLVDRGDSQSSLNQIDVNSIERIEIVEGPMSVIYGSDALAGVINIITKQAAKVQGANSYHVGARLQEESVGREYSFISGDGIHNESVDLAFSHKSGFFVNAGLTRYRNGGWWGENTNRAKEWKAKNQLLGNGTIGYSKNGLNLWYRLDCMDETIWGPEDPSATTPHLLIDQDYLSYRFNHQLQGDWILSDKFILNMAVSYQDYNRQTYTVITNTNTEETYLSEDESAQAVTNYNALMARMTAAWSVAPSLVLQPGVEYQWTHGTGERISGESAEISYMACFLSAEWKPLTWLSIRPGARSFIFSDYNAPTLIPSLLTKFNLTEDLDLRLSYAYGFRTPGIQELYFSYHDSNHDIDGNPDLTAEYSNSFIGSLTYRMIKRRNLNYSLSVGGYYNYFHDRISLAVSIDNPSRYTYYNQDIYKTVGGTLENSLIWKNLRANINFALIGRYNDYFGADDSMTEEFRFSPELTASISYGIPKWGTEVNLFYKFTGARNEYYYSSTTDSSGQIINEYLLGGLPSYNISDLTVSQKLTEWVSLNLGIKNLFNVTTLNSTYITTDSINPHETSSSGVFLGYGRSWSVGLVFSLDAIK